MCQCLFIGKIESHGRNISAKCFSEAQIVRINKLRVDPALGTFHPQNPWVIVTVNDESDLKYQNQA